MNKPASNMCPICKRSTELRDFIFLIFGICVFIFLLSLEIHARKIEATGEHILFDKCTAE